MVWLALLAELAVKCGGVLSNSHYEALGRKDDEANVLTIKTRISMLLQVRDILRNNLQYFVAEVIWGKWVIVRHETEDDFRSHS